MISFTRIGLYRLFCSNHTPAMPVAIHNKGCNILLNLNSLNSNGAITNHKKRKAIMQA